jgi:hypothetical protein
MTIVSLYRRGGLWCYHCTACGPCGGNYADPLTARRMADIHAGLPHPRPAEAP